MIRESLLRRDSLYARTDKLDFCIYFPAFFNPSSVNKLYMAKKKSKKKKAVHKPVRLSTEKYIKLHARKLPLVEVLMSAYGADTGMNHLIVKREKKNGDVRKRLGWQP